MDPNRERADEENHSCYYPAKAMTKPFAVGYEND